MSVSVTSIDAAQATSSTWSIPSPRFIRRLLRRPVAIVCCAYLVAIIAVAIFAPIALPWVKGQNAGNLLAVDQGPSLGHLLGTNIRGGTVWTACSSALR